MNRRAILTGITAGLFALGTAAHAVMFPIVAGPEGDATASDVVKGKTFSSRTAGRGVTGTLELPPNAQSYTNSIGMTFNLIPAGTFIMGSPYDEPGRKEWETQHQVTLTKPFYMQITEVTNKQWNTVIFDHSLGAKPSLSHTGDNYPVENVNWFEAAYFANRLSIVAGRTPCYSLNGCDATVPGAGMECDAVDISDTCTGYRLPTEAQWEYAARATTTTAYANPVYFDYSNTETGSYFNPNLNAMGWYYYNNTMASLWYCPTSQDWWTSYEEGTKPVAAKQANKWGLFDMHGNVWEWCQDWWEYMSDYSPTPVTDPQGNATGLTRVIRGGSWFSDAEIARSARRAYHLPGDRDEKTGFRLILPSGQ